MLRRSGGCNAGCSGVALVGFMGAGKSTVGLALAHKLQWPFLDLDALLTERFGPISALIASSGIVRFRACERDAALSLCDGVRRVLATGGGTLLDSEVRHMLALHYTLVFLDVPFDVAAARIGCDPARPLWDEDVKRRYEERQEIYRMSHLHLDATQPVGELVEAITDMIARLPCP